MNEQLPAHIGGYQSIVCGPAMQGDIWVEHGKPIGFINWPYDGNIETLNDVGFPASVYRKIPVPRACDDKECLKPRRECHVCGTTFTSSQPSAKYCSKKCKHRADKAAEMVRYHSNPDNREKHLRRSREYTRANPEKNRKRAKAWVLANPDKVRIASRRRLGMNNPTGEIKHGPCESCGTVTKLELDHDHSNGNIRGWLCGPCNRALGQAKDSIKILQSLISYLTRFQ